MPCVQADLISSLKARLQLLVEEAERSAPHDGAGGSGADIDGAPAEAHPLLAPPGAMRDGCVLPLPRRVMLPWLVGAGRTVRDGKAVLVGTR